MHQKWVEVSPCIRRVMLRAYAYSWRRVSGYESIPLLRKKYCRQLRLRGTSYILLLKRHANDAPMLRVLCNRVLSKPPLAAPFDVDAPIAQNPFIREANPSLTCVAAMYTVEQGCQMGLCWNAAVFRSAAKLKCA